MSIKKTPSFEHLNEQMRSFDLITRANGILRRVGLGSDRLADLEHQFEALRAQLHDLADYPERFNRYFSKDGWLVHGHLDFTAMKRAVEEYEANGPEAATGVLLQYFGPASLRERLFFLNGVEELRVRRRLIDLAFEDYESRRYHAVVPVLLMLIDGAVNDAVGKGFHAQALNLDVWDSLTAADGAINDIKSIFQQSRRKTRTDAISLPYRNGILHGMDLGYDNEIVAAKCWCFLFVVADWIADKKTEVIRREKFAKETRVPTLSELIEQLAENERMKKATDSWSARQITSAQLVDLNRRQPPTPGTPEDIVIRFLDYWVARNYGGMAKLYWAAVKPESARYAGEVRASLGDIVVESYVIGEIRDEAAAISEVKVSLTETNQKSSCYSFRMIYESNSGEVLPRSLPGGAWRVVGVRPSA